MVNIEKMIRDQLVSTMREELDTMPDPVIDCAGLQDFDIWWGPNTPDGFILKTDRGDFKVTLTVEKITNIGEISDTL